MRTEAEIRDRIKRLEAWDAEIRRDRPAGFVELRLEIAELRWVLGEDKYLKTMREFSTQFAGKSATMDDFRALAGIWKKYDLSSLRQIIYGASPIPIELLKKSLLVFKHTGFFQVYGLTETTGVITVLAPEDHLPVAVDSASRTPHRCRSRQWQENKLSRCLP